VIAQKCSQPASCGFGLLDLQVAPSGSPDRAKLKEDELINEEEFMDIRALHCQGFTYAKPTPGDPHEARKAERDDDALTPCSLHKSTSICNLDARN